MLVQDLTTDATKQHLLNGLFSKTTWVSWYQQGKTTLDVNEEQMMRFLDGSGIGQTICKQCTPLQRDSHASTPSLSFYEPHALTNA